MTKFEKVSYEDMLRDIFAGITLIQLENMPISEAAKLSYKMANAMLEERKKYLKE